jgi:hypothetical protein
LFETFYIFESGTSRTNVEKAKAEMSMNSMVYMNDVPPMKTQSNWLMFKGNHDKKMMMNQKFLFLQDD